jgi:oligopeptide/dipeptide ABC transporter ATP-binding protein
VGDILRRPRHPYTRALIRAVPRLHGGNTRLDGIPGAVPSAADYPPGCRFHPRCVHAQPRCAVEEPRDEEGIRCHFWRELAI